MYEGSWSLFTKSRNLLNKALLNRGLGVLYSYKSQLYSSKFSDAVKINKNDIFWKNVDSRLDSLGLVAM